MKKKLLVIGLALFLLAGCSMKETTSMEISKDKQISLSTTMMYDDEFIDSMLSFEIDEKTEITDELRWEYLDSLINKDELEEADDVELEKIDEDGWKGYIVKDKETVDLDSVSAESASGREDLYVISSLEDAGPLFVKEGNIYTSNMKVDVVEDGITDMQEYVDSMDEYTVDVTIVLPVTASSNNADEVSGDGKTLTWHLAEATETVNIDFSFNMGSAVPWSLIIGIALAVLLLALVLFKIKSTRKNEVVEAKKTAFDAGKEPVSLADMKESAEVKTDEVKKSVDDKVEDVKESAEEKIDDVKEDVSDAREAVEDKTEDVKEKVENKVEDLKDSAEEKINAVKENLSDAKEAVEDKAEDVKEDVSDVKETAEDKIKDAKEAVDEKAEDLLNAVKEKAEEVKEDVNEVKEAVEDKAEDVKEVVEEVKDKLD